MKRYLQPHRMILRSAAALPAVGFVATFAAAQDVSGASVTCLLSVTAQAEAEGADRRVFDAQVSCGPEAPSSPAIAGPEPVEAIRFPASIGETILIGASLIQDADDLDLDFTPDYDFPVRILRIDETEGRDGWSFGTEVETVSQYDHLMLRVWNATAMVDCQEGRDGCRKFGYALLMEELRLDDALTLRLR